MRVEMGQQMALQQQAPGLGPGRIDQPVGGEEAPPRIGQRARQGRGPGQHRRPLGLSISSNSAGNLRKVRLSTKMPTVQNSPQHPPMPYRSLRDFIERLERERPAGARRGAGLARCSR